MSDTKDKNSQLLYQQMILDNTNDNINNMIDQSVKLLLSSTSRIWSSMYDLHISRINNIKRIDILSKTTKLTEYVDYAKKIRDSEIPIPDWFILSSGTTQQKIIPCYDEYIDFIPFALCMHTYQNMSAKHKSNKIMAVFHTSNGMIRNGMHLTDVITRNIYKTFGNLYLLNYTRAYVTSPEQCFLIKNHFHAYYEHIKYGLLCEDLDIMFLISSRQIIMIIRLLFEAKAQLVHDLSLVDSKRAKCVQKILKDDKQYPVVGNLFRKLWPNLKLIVLMTNGEYKIYTEYISKVIGSSIKIYCPVYWTSEVTIGYDIDGNGTYIIDPRKGYFEFMRMKDDEIKGIRDLEIGETYNIIISTTSSDIVRYVTGEIIRFVEYFNGAPRVEIICRETDVIRTKNRLIYSKQIEMILRKKFNTQLVDYCYRHETSENHENVKLYVELNEVSYVKDGDQYIDTKPKIKTINILSALSDQLDILFEVKIVRPGTHNTLYENRYSEEIDPAMVRVPRFVRDEYDLEVLKGGILFMY